MHRTHFTAAWRVRSLRAGKESCLFPGSGNRSIVTLEVIGVKLTQGIETENLPAYRNRAIPALTFVTFHMWRSCIPSSLSSRDANCDFCTCQVTKQPRGRTFESEHLLLGAVVLDLNDPLALCDSVLSPLQLFVQFRRPYVQPLECSHCLRYIGSVNIQLGTERIRELDAMCSWNEWFAPLFC